jgi:1,4-alpha-glucan branching enzyme
VSRLSIVLHTHMPYVEGFGTWPFGEEWLWEAIAASYLPLLDVIDEAPGRVTLSLTPVLCDQLEAPGALDRFEAFVADIRPESHRLDLAAATPAEAAALEHSAAAYEHALARFRARGRDLLAAFAPHVTWTSAATHAVLPLLATDAGIRLQVTTGIAAHRARFGHWDGGFWLPECAHAPWLDERLEEAGVHATCVDLTGRAAPGGPLRTAAGPLLVPIDRAVVDLVWSPRGYPSKAPYRDTHRLTEHRHQAWANDGSAYDPARAVAQARSDAEDFAARVAERDGLTVCALDTELLGHHWHEGVEWLRAVLAAAPVVPLDEALASAEPATAPADLPPTSWGDGRDLRTWSRELAWRQRAAELRVLTGPERPSEPELRELLALQSSDWAFLIAAATAGDYPAERAEDHERALTKSVTRRWNLSPYLSPAAGF